MWPYRGIHPITNIMSLAFELIKVAIGKQDALSRVPTADEWVEILDFSVKHTLVGVMYSGVEKLPKEQRPQKQVLLNWYFTVEKVKERNVTMDRYTSWVAKNFRHDGWQSVILKGQGIARLYPNPQLRMSGDVDVWVKGNRDEIIQYLKANGMKGRIVYHNTEFTIFKDATVEVHFTPSWMNNYFTNRKLQKFFSSHQDELQQNVLTLVEEDGPVCVPTDAFNRVFILQHIYRHLFGSGIGLRQLLDYYYVLQKGCTQDEKAETIETLKQLHMLKFAGAVMYVLEQVFGLERSLMLVEPNVKEGEFLMSEILQAGNFGRYDDRIQIPEHENKLHSFFRISKQNMRLLMHYPEETLWNPLYRAWHFFWRLYKGYPIQ